MLELKAIEKKVLGALLILANNDMEVDASKTVIAQTMGYKSVGGAITFAIQALELKNYISITGTTQYKVLI